MASESKQRVLLPFDRQPEHPYVSSDLGIVLGAFSGRDGFNRVLGANGEGRNTELTMTSQWLDNSLLRVLIPTNDSHCTCIQFINEKVECNDHRMILGRDDSRLDSVAES